MNRLKERLGRLLLVSADEWPVLLHLMALSAVVVGANVVGMSAAVSLFLKGVGVDGLPYMYPLAALAVLAVSPLYFNVVDRVPRPTLLLSCYAFFALAALAMRAGLQVPGGLYLLFMLSYATSQYGTMQFWLVAADLVDTRAAKRLFGLVNFGGSVGAFMFGALVRPLSAALTAPNLLFLWSLTLGACWLLLARIFHRFRKELKAVAPATATVSPHSLREDVAVLREVPIILPATAIHCLMMVVSIFIDFQYNKAAHDTFPTSESLSGFFGMVYGIESMFSITVQLAVLGRLLGWLGVVGTLALHPMLLLLPGLSLWARPGLWTAVGCRLSDQMLQHSVYGTASNAIFGSVPPRQRGRMLVFLKVIASPLCVTTAGILLIVARRAGMDQILVPAILVLVAVWIAVALSLRGPYVATLVTNLADDDEARQMESVEALATSGEDPTRLVGLLLHSGNEDLVAFGLEVVAGPEGAALQEEIVALLAHASSRVRIAALQALPDPDPATLKKVEAALDDPDADVRLEALKLLGAKAPEALRRHASRRAAIEPHAAVLSRALRFLAAERLLTDEHRTRLLPSVASPDVATRRWAAMALDGVPDAELLAALVKLAEDPDEEVRLLSIGGIAHLDGVDPHHVPYLVSGLCGPTATAAGRHLRLHSRIQEACAERLRGIGEGALGPLIEAYETTVRLESRGALLTAIGRVASRRAQSFLLARLEDCPDEFEADLVAALRACSPLAGEERFRVEASILGSVHRALDESLILEALSQSPSAAAVALLEEESQQAIDQQRHLIFDKLGIMVDGPTLTSVRAYLESHDRDDRSTREKNLAAELFENLLSLHIRGPVLALMDCASWQDVARYARAHQHEAHVRNFEALVGTRLQSPDSWLRACAAFAAARLHMQSYHEALERMCHDPDPLVAETCRLAVAAWEDP